MKKRKEMNLISAILNGNEDKLIVLFEKYRPLTEAVKRKYFLKDYDDSDWEQEALIVCLEAVRSYDPAKGEFGSYYKKKLFNQVSSLVRAYYTDRRRAYTLSDSIGEVNDHGESILFYGQEQAIDYSLEEAYDEFYASLSEAELAAFSVSLGRKSLEEVKDELGLNREQLRRAKNRAYHKFKKIVL